MVYWKFIFCNYFVYVGMFMMNQDVKGFFIYIFCMFVLLLNVFYQQIEWYKVFGWVDIGWYKNQKK